MTVTREPGLEAICKASALRGDKTAWRVLYDSANTELGKYVLWRCGGRRDLAEETMQDTWLTAAKTLARFDPIKGSFTEWVCGIARLAVRNRLRTWRRKIQPLKPMADWDIPQKVCEEATPEVALRVTETLAALPEHYETALRAKYLDELSVAEMAVKLKSTEKAVESLLTRAREAFRTQYQAVSP